MPDPKPKKRNINGVLLLDKPHGITSNRALQISKRLFSAIKSGHTGTLDPMATGLLAICFGEATKFSSVILDGDKTYRATLRLGYTSTTGDVEGVITTANTTSNECRLIPSQFEVRLQSFVGKIMQIPPMYSALKFQGKPLYVYARKGEEIERKPREITIYNLSIESFSNDELQIIVKCGTGTYIRTLAEDIGKALGFGSAYLTKLSRITLGNFDLSQAQSLETLETMQRDQRDNCLWPVDSLLSKYSAIELDDVSVINIQHGRAALDQTVAKSFSEGEKVRLYSDKKQFLGLGEIMAAGKIIPKRLMVAC